jgi:ABC-2 type transport system permease protein
MKKALKIFYREFKGYFVSPIAYIVISIFLVITGWFFFSTFFLYNQAELRYFFDLLPITFAFIIPAITMRLFSEEFNTGSYELLLTMPVSTTDIVLGKFFAALAFSAIMLLPTVSYGIFISFIGDLDFGPWIGGYIGAVLLAGAFSAIGLFASSITHNQIIAFILGMAICFTLVLLNKVLFFMPESILNILEYLGAGYHFQNISKGVLDSRDIIYFASVSFIMLYATNFVVCEKN